MSDQIARRRMVMAGLVLPVGFAWSARADALAPTPTQTEGPFYPTRLPADADNDLVQVRGQAARALGQVTHVSGRVLDVGGRPLAGTRVEIWQCDHHGIYDHPRQGGLERRDQAFQGFGQTQTGADGAYRFRTIKPVAYAGRTPHIHVKVFGPDNRRPLTTQMYLAGDPGNEADGLYRGIPARLRERVLLKLEPANGIETGALAGNLDIVVG
jgi:protocatechuate 3,4-dioxygenase, beta subunit